MSLVQLFFQNRSVVRVVIDSPPLRGGISKHHHPKFTLPFESQVGRVTQALMIDGDWQMVVDGHRSSGLWNPKELFIRTIDGVIPVAENAQYKLKRDTDSEEPSQLPPRTTLFLHITACHELRFLALIGIGP